ncbi:MAG TPA: hypothetical protein VFE32_20975 [Puia sp.]|jgi:hypothetical protein|nr:hypothetical protein [Puia sp.]
MSNRLEQFVHDHREEFDGEEPDGKIWEAIRKDMGLGEDPDKKKPAPVVRIYRAAWAVAAAVVLLIAGTVWFFNARQTPGRPAVAAGNQPPARKPATQPDTQTQTPGTNLAQTPAQTPDSGRTGNNLANNTTGDAGTRSDLDESQNEEMYHYARLVEIKQKELKTIEKDEPLLYQQFAMDVNKLDSAYHSLQQQLPKNPNREQILEAMLQNLQLQMGLLNHQLDIIKQINHSKKTAYEKAYKTT